MHTGATQDNGHSMTNKAEVMTRMFPIVGGFPWLVDWLEDCPL